jgi:hypothetical protein
MNNKKLGLIVFLTACGAGPIFPGVTNGHYEPVNASTCVSDSSGLLGASGLDFKAGALTNDDTNKVFVMAGYTVDAGTNDISGDITDGNAAVAAFVYSEGNNELTLKVNGCPQTFEKVPN